MSLRLAAALPSSPCRSCLLNRIQLTSTLSFSTSTTPFSRFWRIPRTHKLKLDDEPVKKIKKKAKKGVFVDAATSTTTTAGGATETGATRASRAAETTQAPFTSRIMPLKKNDQVKHNQRDKSDQHDQHQYSSSSQQGQGYYKRASRLRQEDFLPPRHHRQQSLYRQRLIQFMHQQQQQMHYQQPHNQGGSARSGGAVGGSRGGGSGGAGSNGRQAGYDGRHWGFKPWPSQWPPNWNPWMWWHLMESRKAAGKAFVFGFTLSAMCIGIYIGRLEDWDRWSRLFSELSQAKNAMGATENSVTPFKVLSKSGSPTVITDSFSMLGAALNGSSNEQPFQGLHGSQKSIRMMTPEQVELRLGQHQKSFRVMADQGKQNKQNKRSGQDLIVGYCVNQLPSNSPIEDDVSTHAIRNQDGDIEKVFFGVFDGHSGWCCSQKVASELAPSLARELDLVRNPRDTKAVAEAIERGFLNLDQRLVHDSVKRVLEHPSRPLACASLLPAIAGSCALMAYVNPQERDLYVACTGDSRAVMGVREPLAGGGHVWRAIPLSFDQTGRNRLEVKRLQELHPGEEDTVVVRGRVLGGLEPTRAFGDARYKWSKEIQEKVFQLFPAYRQPYRNFNTPPYVTAKPVVRHHKIRPEDRFLVMATDGLWDKLTSDEVVQLVGDLLDGKTGHHDLVLDREESKRYRQQRRAIQASATLATNYGKESKRQQLLEEEEEESTPANMAQKDPASQSRKFTYRDHANASTHLIRNALGGADDDKLAATLSIPSPMSRVYRDDITVAVVFFNQQDTTLALSDAQASEGFVDIR